MKRTFFILILVGAGLFGIGNLFFGLGQTTPADQGNGSVSTAFKGHRSAVPVSGKGVVVRILSDDDSGSRHQRFILELPSSQTILVAHNIDLAPRIESLKLGDTIAFEGIYEWNPKGGVVHWTHHDPAGRHAPGWLGKGSKTYR